MPQSRLDLGFYHSPKLISSSITTDPYKATETQLAAASRPAAVKSKARKPCAQSETDSYASPASSKRARSSTQSRSPATAPTPAAYAELLAELASVKEVLSLCV